MANVIQTFPKGSGGGSGHTILDSEGTAVAQESKLQFKGVSVTDNSTDGITEFEGEGLNADSIDDIADTTSVVPAVIIGDANNYSTTEKVIGKWIDGKPLYQKTFTGTLTIGAGDNIISSNFKSNNNIDVISKMEGTLFSTNGNVYMLSCASSYYSEMVIESDNLIIRVKGFSTNYSYYATIQYTKTT